jgi:hypothetical protein
VRCCGAASKNILPPIIDNTGRPGNLTAAFDQVEAEEMVKEPTSGITSRPQMGQVKTAQTSRSRGLRDQTIDSQKRTAAAFAPIKGSWGRSGNRATKLLLVRQHLVGLSGQESCALHMRSFSSHARHHIAIGEMPRICSSTGLAGIVISVRGVIQCECRDVSFLAI